MGFTVSPDLLNITIMMITARSTAGRIIVRKVFLRIGCIRNPLSCEMRKPLPSALENERPRIEVDFIAKLNFSFRLTSKL